MSCRVNTVLKKVSNYTCTYVPIYQPTHTYLLPRLYLPNIKSYLNSWSLCLQTVTFDATFSDAPYVIISASHNSHHGNMPQEYNSIATWVEVSSQFPEAALTISWATRTANNRFIILQTWKWSRKYFFVWFIFFFLFRISTHSNAEFVWRSCIHHMAMIRWQ